ncbi:MAG TPA: CRTAC1 family protein [Blastocatellia bacterium]|nr:CRTAC1 family protein [Blastocatellia bacterium]
MNMLALWPLLMFALPAGVLTLLPHTPNKMYSFNKMYPFSPPSVKFTDVSAALQIRFKHEASPTSQKYLPETMGSGVALFDCDGDGRLDIFFVNGAKITDPMPKGALPVKDGAQYANRLYRQKADGTFEDVTEKAGLAGSGYGMGAAVGDYDNDGDEDLYVTALSRNALYRNNGDGAFTDVTDAAGVAASGWSTSAAFVDFNHDGLLDLFVCRYLDWSFEANLFCGERRPGYRAYCHPDNYRGAVALLYRNEGGGRFTDVSRQAGVANAEGKALGVAIADFDRDGLIDIFVANDSVRQFLYRNKGDGTFEDVALIAGAAVNEDGKVYAGMGVDFSDYDNDSWPDVVVTNLSNQMYALYRNAGDGSFAYTTNPAGLGRITLLYSGWGARFMDYDNDGWKDLFIAQGHVLDTIELTSPHLRYLEPPLLARNEGNKGRGQGTVRFADVSAASGEIFGQAWAARGLATGDLDNDGDLDVVVTTTNGRAYVLRNDGGNAANWLNIRLVGRRSNRDGIGAEIKIITPSGALQHAVVHTTASYLSASDRRVHFGLGAEKLVKTIEIRWPSGVIQQLKDVPANQMITITEAQE